MKFANEETRKFWDQREKEKGGKLGFFTFATFLGRSNDRSVNLGGLLYQIGNGLYFEDFEKDNWLLRIMGRKEKYEKTEFGIVFDEIEEIKTVSKSNALNSIQGFISDRELKPVSRFVKIFSQPVTQIKMRKEYSFFFEIMRYQEFLKSVKPELD